MFKHITLIVLFVVLLLAAPVFDAQTVSSAPGATPRATLVATVQPTAEPTVIATSVETPEATAPAVIIAPVVEVTPGPTEPTPREGYISVVAAILIAVISVIAGGLAGGVGALKMLINFLDKVNRDPALLNMIEAQTKSIHVDVLRALNLSGQIIDKVTDGKPNLPNPADLGVLLQPDGSVAFVPKADTRAPGFANKFEGQPLAEQAKPSDG